MSELPQPKRKKTSNKVNKILNIMRKNENKKPTNVVEKSWPLRADGSKKGDKSSKDDIKLNKNKKSKYNKNNGNNNYAMIENDDYQGSSRVNKQNVKALWHMIFITAWYYVVCKKDKIKGNFFEIITS